MTDTLVEEALKKAAVAWVSADGRPAVALWCLPIDGALYVVSGPGEQGAPGLAEATTAEVILRGDHGGQIVNWSAGVTRIDPDTEDWATVAPQLATKRLNASGPATALVARWAAECVISRLGPTDGAARSGAALPHSSLAATPRETSATRAVRFPFRLHKVRRRRPEGPPAGGWGPPA